MLRNLVLSAAAAGLAAGLLTAALQHVATTPLILEAERYEHGASVPNVAYVTRPDVAIAAGTHDHAAPAREGTEVGDGWTRTLSTSLATIVIGVGFALALLGVMILSNRSIDARTGLAFGVAGFAAAGLAPAVGLPPEIPGSAAADLAIRQAWWFFAAASTAAGLAALLLTRRASLWIAGVLLIAVPHIVGAPQPAAFASEAPAELAGHFAAASLVVTAVFWAVLGIAAGAAYERLSRAG